MKFFELKMRLIAPLVVLCCFVCFCCMAPAAFSQVPRGTTVSIGSASQSGSNTTYFYTLTTGTATDVKVGASIVITGMATFPVNADNGTFTITAVSAGQFTVVNAGGVTAGGQMGTGTVVSFSPESGALLEIDGTVGSTPTGHIKVYDSQIQTVNVVTVTAAAATNGSNCNAADLIPSAAYLQQAAAPTGCDDGDVAESGLTFVGSTSTPNKGSFTFGSPNYAPPLPPFNISSQYICLRNNTTVSISAASQSGSTTTYTYTLTSGPALQVGEVLIITGMSNTSDNGTFAITALHTSDSVTTFDVVNGNGGAANSQTGTAIVGACSDTFTNITAASQSGSNTTYTYTVTTGPPLTTALLPNGETVKISCFTGTLAGNNGTFTIPTTAPPTSTTFTVANTGGVSTTPTITNITAATKNGTTTTYTYTVTSGPALQSPLVSCPSEPVTITGMSDAGNNGTFTITALGSGTFSVTNPSGVTTGTTISISAATNNGNGTTTYTYSVTSGVPLETGERVLISGMNDSGNNGTFTINSTPTLTTFNVNNSNPGVTTTTLQNGTGTVTQNGTGTATQVGAGTAAMSNTNGTVFSNDTGFLSVMNTSTSAFTGTIKLSGQPGNSTNCGTVLLTDTVSGLASGASAVLALSNDSSSCGGYNAAQTQTLVAGTTSTFPFGNDAYKITPFDSNSGDMLTVQLVPVPVGPLNASGQYPATIPPGPCTPAPCPQETPISSPLRFSATNFPSQACIAYKDLSAALNPVCAEFQVSCFNGGITCSDALTYLYISELDFAKDPNSLNTIGGNAFLGEHSGSPLGYNGQCPTTGFNLNVFLAYTPTAPDWTKGGGTGSNCYVGTFDPTAAGVPVGQTLRQEFLVGFQDPVVNCTGIFPAACGTKNPINRGRSWPLTWQTFSDPTSTVPVTNLTFCPSFNGSGCPVPPNSSTTPWVFVGTLAVDCTTSVPAPGAMVAVAPGSSSFRNLGALEPGQFPPGTYQLNLDTTNIVTSTGCFTPVLGFSFGFYSFNQAVAQFKQ